MGLMSYMKADGIDNEASDNEDCLYLFKSITSKFHESHCSGCTCGSCSSKENLPVEGNLKLVARYGLLSSDECAYYGPIPNMESPSDHFPLLCKFVLTP